MMYYKIINNRQVFSSCKVIKLNGRDVSNPTAEMIDQAGWQVFVPPIVPPQPQTDPDFSQVMAAVKKMLSTETSELSDEDALDVAALFPTWVSKLPADPLNPKPDDTLPTGYRVWYDGKLYKVLQPHVPQNTWTPDHAQSLYAVISIEEIPDWEQPSSTNPYMTGDKVKHNGIVWESKVDNNVWEPGVVADNIWHNTTND